MAALVGRGSGRESGGRRPAPADGDDAEGKESKRGSEVKRTRKQMAQETKGYGEKKRGERGRMRKGGSEAQMRRMAAATSLASFLPAFVLDAASGLTQTSRV